MQNPYLDQYIYNITKIRYPNSNIQEKMRIIFKQLINGIRDITSTTEINSKNIPMGFLFQYLKPDIIKLVANCSPPTTRNIILKNSTFSLEWNIQLFETLITLDAKDIIIWYFLHIPYYIENIGIQLKIRELYIQMLDYLILHWPVNYKITEEEFIFASNETCMPYAIAYHNKNNTELLTKYCKLIRKIAPWINYYNPRIAEEIIKKAKTPIRIQSYSQQYSYSQSQLDKNNKENKDNKENKENNNKVKKRICFISDSFSTDSSVLRDRIGIIGKCDKTVFDVYIASFIAPEFYKGILADTFIKKYKTVYIHLKTPLNEARKQIEELELDIIIYPDLGMKLLPTLLAYSRLAKIQITTWGHSETSGIDTIDYFISSQWFESKEISLQQQQQEYTEQLVCFKSLGTYYFSPHTIFINNNSKLPPDYKFKTALELGFSSKTHIYCCLQTFYKMSTEFEATLALILQLDRDGIILLSNSFPYCQSHLARLYKVIGKDNINRIKWIPGLDKPNFLNLVAISDVCLDTFPFGGCNTTFEAFDYNIPVITLPSTRLHGRFTYGLYCKMNMADCECIATNGEEYAHIATRIAINIKLRHKIQREIEMKKHLIFQEKESVDEWNCFLEGL